jgi:hypothetical protein
MSLAHITLYHTQIATITTIAAMIRRVRTCWKCHYKSRITNDRSLGIRSSTTSTCIQSIAFTHRLRPMPAMTRFELPEIRLFRAERSTRMLQCIVNPAVAAVSHAQLRLSVTAREALCESKPLDKIPSVALLSPVSLQSEVLPRNVRYLSNMGRCHHLPWRAHIGRAVHLSLFDPGASNVV